MSAPQQSTVDGASVSRATDIPKLPETTVDTSLSLEQIINGEGEKFNLDPSAKSELDIVQQKASNVLKLAEENERLKQQLEEMTQRLEAAEQRSKAVNVHSERVREEKEELRQLEQDVPSPQVPQ